MSTAVRSHIQEIGSSYPYMSVQCMGYWVHSVGIYAMSICRLVNPRIVDYVCKPLYAAFKKSQQEACEKKNNTKKDN